MPPTPPDELVRLLQSAKLRVRTGLWLVPPSQLGNEPDDAVRLGLQAIDVRDILLATVDDGQRYLSLTASDVYSLVDKVGHHGPGHTCYLLYNLDLLIAALAYAERRVLWEYLFDGLPHRPHALLIIMPKGADHLLPPMTYLDRWRTTGRLADL